LILSSVLEEDSLFTAADEEMVAVMDVQRKVDSFRLLALKHRIVTATKEWMRAFCESGGISDINSSDYQYSLSFVIQAYQIKP